MDAANCRLLVDKIKPNVKGKITRNSLIFQHDNAQLHVTKCVKNHLENLKWDVLPQFCLSYGKGFLYRVVTSDEKWIYFGNPKCKKSSTDPGQSFCTEL